MEHHQPRKYPRKLLLVLAGAAVVFGAMIISFVALVDEVREGDTLRYDEAILYAVNSHSTPFLDTAMRIVTDFGSVGVAIAVAIGAVIYMIKRHTYRALFLLVGVGGAGLLSVLLKLLFERPRPELWERLVVEMSFAFPSGHAMASSALAFSAIALFWKTRHRWWVVAGASVYMLVIAYSRLYLGVHYPTDILGGWLISGAWILLVVTLMWHRHELNLVK